MMVRDHPAAANVLRGVVGDPEIISEIRETGPKVDERPVRHRHIGMIDTYPLSSGSPLFLPARVGTRHTMDRLAEKEARAARLRWARRHAGYKSARNAAMLNQWNEHTYKAHESGFNGFGNDIGRKYASKYKVELAWLMTGEGVAPEGYDERANQVETRQAPEGDGSMIPITGTVRSGGLVDFSAAGTLGNVPPPPVDGEWRALEISGDDAIRPTYQDRDILYYSSARYAPEQVVNRECVVSVSGAIYVRFVRRGAEAGRWHLSAVAAEPLMNQSIDWASPIQWVRKRELTAA